MKINSPEWHDRQLAHAKECIDLCKRVHTPEEIAEAERVLANDPKAPQEPLRYVVRDLVNS